MSGSLATASARRTGEQHLEGETRSKPWPHARLAEGGLERDLALPMDMERMSSAISCSLSMYTMKGPVQDMTCLRRRFGVGKLPSAPACAADAVRAYCFGSNGTNGFCVVLPSQIGVDLCTGFERYCRASARRYR